jgi:hypothetical protein
MIGRGDIPWQDPIEHGVLTRASADGEMNNWGNAEIALVRPDGYFAWLGSRETAAAGCAHWISGVRTRASASVRAD